MPFITAIITAIFCLKGLGGSFHALITKLGLVLLHGPIIGGVASLMLLVSFYLFATRPRVIPSSVYQTPTARQRMVVSILFCVLILASIGIRAGQIHRNPININQADMLPLIRAGTNVAAQWQSPYRPYRLENGMAYPGFYLPTLWMVFMPARWLGIDLRWTTVVSQIVFYTLLLNIFLSRRTYPGSFNIASAIFLTAIALHTFSKLAVGQVVSVHTAGFSLFLSLFIWSVWRGSKWLPAFILPLLVLSRELAILFALPYGIHLFLRERARFWKYLGIISVVGFGISLPFLILAGSDFFSVFRFYAAHTKNTDWETMMQFYGWCGFLKKYHLTALQPFLQLSGLAAASVLLAKGKCRQPLQVLALGGVVFVPFILFVSTTWAYLYLEPIILLYFLLFAGENETNERQVSTGN